MMSPWIFLLVAGAAKLLSAEFLLPSDCSQAKKLCLKDSVCNASHHEFMHCTHGIATEPVNKTRCQQAELALKNHGLMDCKCRRRMNKEEHCLNVYWNLHPLNVQGYHIFESSPYEDDDHDIVKTDEYSRVVGMASDTEIPVNSNACFKQAIICSLTEKCSWDRNAYADNCSKKHENGQCDRQRCHQSLRRFFKKVPQEFSKRLLFCPCQESYCAERRRKTIVPECSFEEESKPNCLHLYHSCMNDNLCKSRFADFQKHCYSFNKRTKYCPKEQYDLCIQTYMRMIGTIMTPNFISNNSISVSLWCTCEGSGNRQDDCSTILGMFMGNTCLENAIKSELGEPIETDSVQTVPMDMQKEDTNLSVIPGTNLETDNLPVKSAKQNKIAKVHNPASRVSSPSMALTLLSPALLLWLLKSVRFA
ncbi:GDNF family receptor alpha-3 [Spea bombifrons]|uniref:GDNF family receptor alpha-3 n=1 Tax=Spea bombifrons TaxID=233779 RepID=UPI00234BFF3A|nr:GDNF family receptor alpha-3 [Spea bombifrons]